MNIVKELAFGEEARLKLISGIDKISNAVKSTLGARGHTVLIESPAHTHGITITKDGVTVANSIILEDPTENLAVNLVRSASQKTAVQASDGTTTAIVLTQAIVHEAQGRIKPTMNQTEIIRHLRIAGKEVLKRLDAQSIPISSENIKDVAIISANGDIEIGTLIADAYQQVGKKGTVTVEKSKTKHTHSDVISGMRIERGWTSKYFLTNPTKQECVLINPYIFVCDKKIEKMQSIERLVLPAIKEKRPFLIIGEVSEDLLEEMNFNTMQGIVSFCQINPPDVGYKGSEMLEDIAIATGAKYFSEGSGDNFELIQPMDLGRADKVIVGLTHTIIVPGENIGEEVKERTLGRVEELEQKIKEEGSIHELPYLKERLGNMTGGVGVIFAGGVSDIEAKELRDRIDDSVGAVACAIEGGIVSGGGIALLDISNEMKYGDTEEGRVAWHILKSALQAPYKQILTNGGFANQPLDMGIGIGFDVSKGVSCNMIQSGIIDPCKVTKTAFENALSVAATLLSTDCIITNVRDYGKQ